MAHDIGQMFYCGETPWHQLGNRLPGPATVEQALAAGGLDWTVSLVPIVPAGEPDSAISHRMAVVRDDQPAGWPDRVVGVVHPGFRPLQNREAAQLFDALIGPGRAVYHTGGYLRHGEVIWLLARLPKEINVGGKDPVEPYLLFTNSHDGSVPIDIRLTTVRVVCQNTLSIALGKNASGQVFRASHGHSVRWLAEQAKAFFQISLQHCDEAQALFSRLAATRCDAESFKRFMEKLLPDPATPATAAASTKKAHATRIENLREMRTAVVRVFTDGIADPLIAPADPTWWGAVNAVTAWVDHQQTIEGDRYAHALFGSGDALKTRALNRAGALAARELALR